MAVWEEPLRYIRRFILTEEELEAAGEAAAPAPEPPGPTSVESAEAKMPQTLPQRMDYC